MIEYPPSIRPVALADIARLREIYRPSVEENAVSFETVLPSEDEFARRINDVTSRYPWLVYEHDGEVVAYAYASVFKARAAYDWTVESSIYVHQDFQKRGIGKRLYGALFDDLKARGIANVIAVIALPNDASVFMHEAFGFRHAGRLEAVGLKFDRWWDIGYWQNKL